MTPKIDNYFRVIRRDGTGNRFSLLEDTFTFATGDPHTVGVAYAKALRHMEKVDAVSIAVHRPLPERGEWSELQPEWHERTEQIEEADGTIHTVDRGYWTGVPLIGQFAPPDLAPPPTQQALTFEEPN